MRDRICVTNLYIFKTTLLKVTSTRYIEHALLEKYAGMCDVSHERYMHDMEM